MERSFIGEFALCEAFHHVCSTVLLFGLVLIVTAITNASLALLFFC